MHPPRRAFSWLGTLATRGERSAASESAPNALADGARRVLVGLLAGGVGFSVPWGDSAAGQDRFLPVLPEGNGVEMVRQRCGLCHGLELVAQQRLGRADWSRVVDQMIEFGAALRPEDRRDIVDYLSSYLGPDKRGD